MLLVSGCRDGELVRLGSEITVTPERLDFGQRWVGHPHAETLTLTNRSRASQVVVVKVPAGGAPFSIEVEELELGGGAELKVPVTYAPDAAGRHEAALTLELEGERLDVPLVGEARLPPQCPSPEPCVDVSFDPAAGACVSVTRPDDAPCTSPDACLVNGRCEGGACVGEARACDDGNACTLDACDPSSGCIAVDESASCPAPESPCHVAFCDPQTGCGKVEALDGTRCGPADCITAHVCLSGVCKPTPVPDGFECAPATPCRDRGVCVDQVCEQPAPGPLKPLWTYGPIGGDLRFNGVADAQDNLYWAECPLPPGGCSRGVPCAPCFAVSATRDGVERWRAEVIKVRGFITVPYSQLLVGGVLVTFMAHDSLEARDTANGTLLWSRDLRTDYEALFYEPTVPDGDRQVTIGHPSADASSTVYVPVSYRNSKPGSPQGALLVALDAATGATRWTSGLSFALPESAVDEAGNVYVAESVQQDAAPNYLTTSWTPAGTTRWIAPMDEGRFPAVSGGVLVTGGYTGLDAATGAQRWIQQNASVQAPVIAGGTVWWLRWILGDQRYELVRGDLQLGTELWSTDLGPQTYASQLSLTAQDSALVLTNRSDAQVFTTWALVEIDSAGAPTFTCELPSPTAFAWHVVLLKDRVVMQVLDAAKNEWKLTAYDLPGRSLRPSGWVTENGSNARSSSPR